MSNWKEGKLDTGLTKEEIKAIFKQLESKSTKPGERLHCDLCAGLFRVPSMYELSTERVTHICHSCFTSLRKLGLVKLADVAYKDKEQPQIAEGLPTTGKRIVEI